jgi:hypothetical protein
MNNGAGSVPNSCDHAYKGDFRASVLSQEL